MGLRNVLDKHKPWLNGEALEFRATSESFWQNKRSIRSERETGEIPGCENEVAWLDSPVSSLQIVFDLHSD